MKRRNIIVNTTLGGLFCALICVGAFIKIPIPNLPITMQVFFVLLSGLILPWKTALIANFSYMTLGLIGIPLFTGGGGIGYIFVPTFGFILGFVLASAVTAAVSGKMKNNSFWHLLLTAFLGILLIYSVGVPYFALSVNVYNGGGKSLLWFIQAGVLPFIPKEIISALAAALTAYKIRPLIAKIK